jgi:sugar-specific transcriptional regulator TrmB
MDLKELNKIGLTEGEIKVYDALLDLGECTKTSLVKKSGISPSNIYDITNRLAEKGIISKVDKNGVSHFSPANPNHILDFITNKEKELQKEKDLVNQLLPSLLMKFGESKEKVNVEVFNGWNGLSTIFEDLISECTSADINYVFGASTGENSIQSDIFFMKYSRLRAEKGIITKIIFNEDIKSRKERITFFQNSKNYELKFLQQTTPSEIMIYKNKACILILSKEPLVIRVSSKEVAESFKQYFDVMWEKAKK